ncbi:MAG: glutamyl-tRNA amidotransferase [Candidatus Micrarchaeota archaeon]|nr:MAG: glutamyl-tRNA amidotransferase [Candidatus Micrarchaeota archaeon]
MNEKIGLEIHVRLNTKTKLFCSDHNNIKNAKPNSNTCPVCMGFPGSKPVLNKEAVRYGVMIALALNCSISSKIFFSRKTYFYPDMSKNYQITQYEIPIGREGYLEISNGKRIRIRRVHIEEDPAKILYPTNDLNTSEYLLVDYNRSGMPLSEIVTEPDFSDKEEVREFMDKLISILEHLGVFDAQADAALRADVNVSIENGERVEVKNVSGLENIERAITYEIIRQRSAYRLNGRVERETRHFSEVSGTTTKLRAKEFEEDYGYIFDPDLPIVKLSDELIEKIKSELPELPDKRIERFIRSYKIEKSFASILVNKDKQLADFFEESLKYYNNPESLAKWITTFLLKSLNWHKLRINQTHVKPEVFALLIRSVDENKISDAYAKDLIKIYVDTGKDITDMIKSYNAINKEDIEKIARRYIESNMKAVSEYKKGNIRAIDFIIGSILKETKKRADPKLVKEIVIDLIDKEEASVAQ